ncbi:MAG: transposase [Desulfovibrio sp.]
MFKDNRKSQAGFKFMACGFECNADCNAALNILTAGQAVTAFREERARSASMKQEPAWATAPY